MPNLLNNLIYPGILAIVTGLTGYIVWLLQQNKKTTDANARGTMLLLRREIISDYNKYIIDGEDLLPLAFADLEEIHNAYKALGGNGMTDEMFKAIQGKHFAKGGL